VQEKSGVASVGGLAGQAFGVFSPACVLSHLRQDAQGGRASERGSLAGVLFGARPVPRLLPEDTQLVQGDGVPGIGGLAVQLVGSRIIVGLPPQHSHFTQRGTVPFLRGPAVERGSLAQESSVESGFGHGDQVVDSGDMLGGGIPEAVRWKYATAGAGGVLLEVVGQLVVRGARSRRTPGADGLQWCEGAVAGLFALVQGLGDPGAGEAVPLAVGQIVHRGVLQQGEREVWAVAVSPCIRRGVQDSPGGG
jgi:hypothetical protein